MASKPSRRGGRRDLPPDRQPKVVSRITLNADAALFVRGHLTALGLRPDSQAVSTFVNDTLRRFARHELALMADLDTDAKAVVERAVDELFQREIGPVTDPAAGRDTYAELDDLRQRIEVLEASQM